MDSSVSHWIQRLKRGDSAATRQLFQRYWTAMVSFAAQRISGSPRSVADEEDVAQDAFLAACQFLVRSPDDIECREEFWRLLVTILVRKGASHARTFCRHRMKSLDEPGEETIDGAVPPMWTIEEILAGREPPPGYFVEFEDELHHLLQQLRDDQMRRIVLARIAGQSTAEIAAQLGITTRAAQRKLNIVFKTWCLELHDESFTRVDESRKSSLSPEPD